MNKEKLKRLQEKAKSLGKLLLIEEVSIDSKTKGVIIEKFDKPLLKEDLNGKSIECRGVVRNVPVTKYTENLNGRIYPKPLWEKVMREGTFYGSDCNADHAEDEPSVKDIAGVWGPLRVGEETSNSDLYCIGENGSLMLEKIKAGGRVGFSTVGFGELSESDDKTVDPESFEYESTDWVTAPSQEVYATKENLLMPRKDTPDENKSAYEPEYKVSNTDENSQKSNNFENVNTNNKEKILKENSHIQEKKEVLNMDVKLQEASFRNQINKTLKEAVKKENFLEAIDELKGLKIPEEYIDLKEKIESTIDSLQLKLEEQMSNAKKSLAEKESSEAELKAKLDESNKMIAAMKEKFGKIQTVLQKNDIKELKDVSALKESLKNMEYDIKCLKEDKAAMEADLKVFNEDTAYRDYDIKRLTEDLNKTRKQFKAVMSERKDMLSDIAVYEKILKHAEKYILNLRNRLKEEGVDDEEVEKLGEVDEAEMEGSKKEEDQELSTVEGQTKDQVDTLNSPIVPIPAVNSDPKANADVQNLGEEVEDETTMEDEPVMTEEDTEPIDWEGLDNGSEKAEGDEFMGGSSEKGEMDEEDDDVYTGEGSVKEEDADDDKMAAVRAAQEGGDPVLGSSKKAEKFKYKFSTIDPKKVKVKEATTKKVATVDPNLVAFYEAQVQKNAFIADFKKEILGAKSLIQAIDMIDKLKEKSSSDKVVKFGESTQIKDSWVPKNRY